MRCEPRKGERANEKRGKERESDNFNPFVEWVRFTPLELVKKN